MKWTIYISDGREIGRRGETAVVVTRDDGDPWHFEPTWWIGEDRWVDPASTYYVDIEAIHADQIRAAQAAVAASVEDPDGLTWHYEDNLSVYPYGWALVAEAESEER